MSNSLSTLWSAPAVPHTARRLPVEHAHASSEEGREPRSSNNSRVAEGGEQRTVESTFYGVLIAGL